MKTLYSVTLNFQITDEAWDDISEAELKELSEYCRNCGAGDIMRDNFANDSEFDCLYPVTIQEID